MQGKKVFWIVSAIGILVVVVCLTVVLIRSNKKQPLWCTGSDSYLGELCSDSELGTYHHYAVSTDSNVCAPAGKAVLEENGNAIDAVISVLLCMGVTIPESMGLAGGSMIIFYNKTTNKARFIDAREMAPKAAYRDLFNSSDSVPNGSSLGPQSFAIPGELAGYWHMYENYGSGNIPWKRLFRDAINFAENGFPVGQHLHDAMEQKKSYILNYTRLRNVYVNPETGLLYRKDEILKQPMLAETLRNLSENPNPRDYFYKEIAKKILYDLHNDTDFPEITPIITLEDFDAYNVSDEEAFVENLRDNITLHTAKLPGSGQVLNFILKIMLHPKFKEMYPNAKKNLNQAILFYHRLMETFKFAYAKRMHLGDDRFDNCSNILEQLNSEKFIDFIVKKINDSTTYSSNSGFYDVESYQDLDHGTAHVSVMDKDGNAVSVSTTVNLYFGSKMMSPSTGLILNDEMDDFNIGKTNSFDLPVAYQNIIEPFKRPLSSMSPSVFTDDTGVRLVIGASGGSKITTAVSLVTLRHLWMGDDIKVAIDAARLHHQLFPVNVENEEHFPENILDALRERHHEVKQLQHGVRGAIVMAISRSRDNLIHANSDWRKGGTISGE